MFKTATLLAGIVALGMMITAPVFAADITVIDVIIKDHKFQPDRIEVEAGKAFTLMVKNDDATPEEFESHDLNREKIINGHSSAKIRIGALEPGEYKFFGEFNEDSAQGVIVAK
ncbi:cupredoxin domain-containing protein [Sneathiella sp.]|uniref:cupredoxin domain-containing protein n=1 Tax=Sneathiella sp. TaxID=1964365 RepID=UPI003562BD1B